MLVGAGASRPCFRSEAGSVCVSPRWGRVVGEAPGVGAGGGTSSPSDGAGSGRAAGAGRTTGVGRRRRRLGAWVDESGSADWCETRGCLGPRVFSRFVSVHWRRAPRRNRLSPPCTAGAGGVGRTSRRGALGLRGALHIRTGPPVLLLRPPTSRGPLVGVHTRTLIPPPERHLLPHRHLGPDPGLVEG